MQVGSCHGCMQVTHERPLRGGQLRDVGRPPVRAECVPACLPASAWPSCAPAQGSSGSCGTFGSPSLSGSEEFTVAALELWSLQ